jgi:acyl carrier protein
VNAEARAEIRRVLRAHARLPVDPDALQDDADLFQAGMTSQATVTVMLALEYAFEIEFPDRMLTRSVFESVNAIAGALQELATATAA